MTVFGDTLAMVLVVIGAALTGLLIWLLIRKYDREHGIDGASRRKADAGMSPLSGETASPVSPVCGHEVAPEGGPRETAQSTDALRMCPITAFSGKEPTPDDATAHGGGPVATSLPPKDPPGTSPITLSSGEEALLSSPPGDAPKVPPSGEAHLSEKSRPEAKKVPEHTKRSSTAGRSRESLQLTKERTSRDQHGKRKTKKPAAAPLNAIDSSADPSQGVRPHDDVNDPAIQELREEFAPRAPDGSHCAFPLPRHQSDQTPIPAELDIFSVEHSTSDAAAASRAAPRQESAQREGRVPTDVSSLPSDGATARNRSDDPWRFQPSYTPFQWNTQHLTSRRERRRKRSSRPSQNKTSDTPLAGVISMTPLRVVRVTSEWLSTKHFHMNALQMQFGMENAFLLWSWITVAMSFKANAMPVLEDTLVFNYPWFQGYNPNWHSTQSQLWPQPYLLSRIEAPEEACISDSKDQLYYQAEFDGHPVGGEDLDRFDTPRATANDMHGAHFGGDYAFPRYGGQSRMSRYGIDYGDYHARRHGFRGPYNYRPDARSFGAPSDAAFHDGLAYPRWTGHFSGQEHPTTFDPHLTNPYYRDPFHAQRFVAQYPYFRI
ncbi:hypothetical protein HPB49_017810 [Dermacentor silvarum]|uniref:Uncharacterized protein n=1 Tax=Dermacentor silvarum TaxID=543639 RepID=A0ACB8CSD3_DERSI|nr:hypothetical protein HPB49_017810 [Dermacentor silvarum]